jgi:hypothetical protein
VAKRVRVIRVLEYSYPDQATYEADIARWQVPPNGTKNSGQTQINHETGARRKGTVIRSATTLVETMPEGEEPGDGEPGGPVEVYP